MRLSLNGKSKRGSPRPAARPGVTDGNGTRRVTCRGGDGRTSHQTLIHPHPGTSGGARSVERSGLVSGFVCPRRRREVSGEDLGFGRKKRYRLGGVSSVRMSGVLMSIREANVLGFRSHKGLGRTRGSCGTLRVKPVFVGTARSAGHVGQRYHDLTPTPSWAQILPQVEASPHRLRPSKGPVYPRPTSGGSRGTQGEMGRTTL